MGTAEPRRRTARQPARLMIGAEAAYMRCSKPSKAARTLPAPLASAAELGGNWAESGDGGSSSARSPRRRAARGSV
jgi:hypothetical protein